MPAPILPGVLQEARQLIIGGMSMAEVAKRLDVDRVSLYRRLGSVEEIRRVGEAVPEPAPAASPARVLDFPSTAGGRRRRRGGGNQPRDPQVRIELMDGQLPEGIDRDQLEAICEAIASGGCSVTIAALGAGVVPQKVHGWLAVTMKAWRSGHDPGPAGTVATAIYGHLAEYDRRIGLAVTQAAELGEPRAMAMAMERAASQTPQIDGADAKDGRPELLGFAAQVNRFAQGKGERPRVASAAAHGKSAT